LQEFSVIRDLLSVVPARPVVFVVPLIVVLVMSWYYWDMYSKCTDIKQFRASLNEELHSLQTPAGFRLANFTGFTWDQVRIVEQFDPEIRSSECPLGWNWPGDERDSLIASGLLTLVIFLHRGIIVEYLELRSDEVAFRGAETSLSPETAVFNIGAHSAESGGVTLTLND
jgi:heme/copper-type cytochrome/quinol oxidase subunit 2